MRRWTFFFSAFSALFILSFCCSAPPPLVSISAHEAPDTDKVTLWNACRELSRGRPRDEVRRIIEKYKLEKQHWAAVGDGTSFEWWRWRKQDEKREDGTYRVYSSLDIEVHNNALETFTCYLVIDGKFEGHLCDFGMENCPHLQKETMPEPVSSPVSDKLPLWLK